MEELKDRNDNLSRAQSKREGVEEKMKGKKKEMGQLNRELAAIEKDMREKVCYNGLTCLFDFISLCIVNFHLVRRITKVYVNFGLNCCILPL